MTDDSDEILALVLEEVLSRPAPERNAALEAAVKAHPPLETELRELCATARLAHELAKPASPESLSLGTGRRSGPPSFDLSDDFQRSFRSLPRTVGDFELLEELGRGGMGVVYKARDLKLHRWVALKKILRGDLASSVDRARFRAEAEAAARLEHPGIVRLYEVGELEGEPFFSMQYVPGTTLARRLADGPLPGREAAKLLAAVCRAIAHAHRHGVLHRDLKPSNILLDESGEPFVTDFGLAKRISTTESLESPSISALTHSGAIVGTPGYMAPEQALGVRGELGPATDVFSLGAVLYALLTGRPPFQTASPLDMVLMVLEQDPPPPRLLNPQVDVDLEFIALKALQKPTDLRYATPDAMADDLEAFLNHEPISARTSHFSQILSRAFRPTHHLGIMENWGLLWMWHALVLLILCVVTNVMQLGGVLVRAPYLGLWIFGLGTWGIIFWNLRRRSGPVTFVERQIAHVWAASMAGSTMLFGVEWLLDLPVLKLSPVLPLLAAAVFVAKAGILSGEFYLQAVCLFATSVPMALFPRYGLTIFGIVSAATFFLPGLKFHRQRIGRKT